MPCIRAPRGYSLLDTLLPSFTLPLFRLSSDGTLVKIHGWRVGSTLWVDEDKVCCEGCTIEELMAWSGLWLYASLRLAGADSNVVIGLSVSPWDARLIFSAVFLSRNTRYDRVLNWMRRIASYIEESRYDEITRVAEAIGSYQVRELPEALREFDESFRAWRDIWKLRSALLGIRGVGVKTAHATILFATFTSILFPVDRHLLRVEKGASPRKELCKRWPCTRCPLRSECIVSKLYRRFGRYAGLYQTMVWLLSVKPSERKRLLEIVKRF